MLVDPFYWGECTIKQRGYLFALLVNSVGQRPLGVQAGQLAAVARWAQTERRLEASEIVAVGPRASLATLVAAALEPRAVSRVELRGTYGSLREVLEQNLPYEQAPEVFCFGLLAAADVRSLIGVVAPREVSVVEPSDRARLELTDLAAWYETLGKSFDPVASHGTK